MHEHGWWVKGTFDDTPVATQVYRLVRGRRLNQLPFAYDVVDQRTVTVGTGSRPTSCGMSGSTSSPSSPIGANQDTSVLAVKSTAVSRAATATLTL